MESPSSAAAAPAEPNSSIVRMIEALYAKRHSIKTLLMVSIDDKSNTDALWSSPPNPLVMSHLWRTMNVKIDRYYARAMFPVPQPAGPVAGVKGNSHSAAVPRAVRRQMAKAEKKVKRAASKGEIPALIKAKQS